MDITHDRQDQQVTRSDLLQCKTHLEGQIRDLFDCLEQSPGNTYTKKEAFRDKEIAVCAFLTIVMGAILFVQIATRVWIDRAAINKAVPTSTGVK